MLKNWLGLPLGAHGQSHFVGFIRLHTLLRFDSIFLRSLDQWRVLITCTDPLSEDTIYPKAQDSMWDWIFFFAHSSWLFGKDCTSTYGLSIWSQWNCRRLHLMKTSPPKGNLAQDRSRKIYFWLERHGQKSAEWTWTTPECFNSDSPLSPTIDFEKNPLWLSIIGFFRMSVMDCPE